MHHISLWDRGLNSNYVLNFIVGHRFLSIGHSLKFSKLTELSKLMTPLLLISNPLSNS